MVDRLDALEAAQKLVIISAIEARHAELLWREDHDGSAHCACELAKILRVIHGDPEPERDGRDDGSSQ